MSPVVFAGSVQQKKKTELQELAVALKISDQGTRDSLQTRIKEHLDDHQATLEDNPRFAGLYVRKRRSVQPQFTRVASSVDEPDSKPVTAKSRDDKKISALEPLGESTPISELRGVSVYLKKAPASPPEALPSKPNASPRSEREKSPVHSSAPLSKQHKGPVERVHTSAARNVLPLFSQQELVDSSAEMLLVLRNFLSNSRNIWSLTAVAELLFIIYTVIPWRSARVPLIPASETFFHVFYPPFDIFKTQAFWLVMLHWFIPTLLVPSICGNLISFTPSETHPSSPRPLFASRIIPFDPLTASIVRLAAEIAYPYASIETRTEILGLDVIGFRFRVLSASIGLAFAFAEAIAGAPRVFVEKFFAEQRKCLTDGGATAGRKSGVALDETLVEVNK
jgi:hypothetical protein